MKEESKLANAIKFIHIADIHLDAWREKELKILNFKSLERVVNIAIERDVDFVLMSGDILHVSMPSINAIRFLTRILSKLKDNNIKVFAIPGSHDLSSDENSFLYVLEDAGLLTLTSKGQYEEEKLIMEPAIHKDVIIYGLMGKRASLDKEDYKKIKLKDFEKHQNKLKIFQMHIGVNEIMPEKFVMQSNISLNDLPSGFDYYASGHIHKTIISEQKSLKHTYYIVYPGPLYTDNIAELEDMKGRSNYVYVEAYNTKEGWKLNVKHEWFVLKDVEVIDINADGLTPAQVENKALNEIEKSILEDKIVLIKYRGVVDGLVSNINFKEIENKAYEKGAYLVKKSIRSLESKAFNESVVIDNIENIHDIENSLIEEYMKGVKGYFFDSLHTSKVLLRTLSEIRGDEETRQRYEDKIISKAMEFLEGMINNQSLVVLNDNKRNNP